MLGGESPQEKLAEGDAAFRNERYERAVRRYERAAESPEVRFGALLGLARAREVLEDYDESLIAAERAVAAAGSGEERAVAHNFRGLLYSRLHFAAIDPTVPGRDSEGTRREAERHLDESLEAFGEALRAADVEVPEVLLNLARAQSLRRRFEDARASLDRFLEAEPGGWVAAAELDGFLDCVERTVGLQNRWKGLREEEGFEPPERLRGRNPRASSADGWAAFQGVIDREGRLNCARPVHSEGLPPEFLAGATGTLSEWVYRPATLDGEPVEVVWRMTVRVEHL